MTLLDLDPETLRHAIAEAKASGDLKALATLKAGLDAALRWKPEPYQEPPPLPWWAWAFRGGRGSGKTDTGSWYTDEHMSGPACDTRVPGGHRAAIVGPTFGDVVAACFAGPSGLRAHNATVRKVGRKEGTFVVWPNGSEAVLLGAHTESDADRLRAQGNICLFWFDEAAIMRYLKIAVDNVALGARLGNRPHGIVTSTPKSYPAYARLLNMPGVVQTTASTFQNPYLPAQYRAVVRQYEGSRLGRQELFAELLSDYEGALWVRDQIDTHRLEPGATPQETIERYAIHRIVEGIDPSTWDPDLGDDPGTLGEGLETGIVVVGIDDRDPPHVYVLDDLSIRGSGEQWAKAAAGGYHAWEANSVVPETNAGGGLVLTTIRLVDPSVTIYRGPGGKPGVRAAQGKRARAEPVATLAEQGRLHHVGTFPVLEDQLVGWDPRESWSPDRLDALVWAVTALAPWQVAESGSGLDAMRQSIHR